MIRIKNLLKTYGENPILKGVDLDIAPGEFVSLLGPSGSGKTTLLRCFAGLEQPDSASGEIRLGDRVFSGPGAWTPPEKRDLGMVFQNYAVWPHLTVAENVAFPLKIRKLAPGAIRAKVGEALALVKLEKLRDRYAHQLSGGQQQRVSLARALVVSPQALLLDEPLSNLDALLREELGTEIRRLQQKLKLTTILVTHDQKEALSLSDRIVLLNLGRIDAQGTPEELYTRPPTPFAAEFLASADRAHAVPDSGLSGGPARELRFLPRRWSVASSTSAGEWGDFEVESRLYLGNEYEYRARSPRLSAPVRFYAGERYETGRKVRLEYRE